MRHRLSRTKANAFGSNRGRHCERSEAIQESSGALRSPGSPRPPGSDPGVLAMTITVREGKTHDHPIREHRPDPAHLRRPQGRRVLSGLFSASRSIGITASTTTRRSTAKCRAATSSCTSASIMEMALLARALRLMIVASRNSIAKSAPRPIATCGPVSKRRQWGTLETGAIDPFGNLIRFCERDRQTFQNIT